MTMPGEHAVDVEDLKLDDAVAPEDRDLEVSPEDAYEQATPADPRQSPVEPTSSIEVNEYDAIEQATLVEPGDEYDR